MLRATPTRLGSFVLERRLAFGTMAEVFLALGDGDGAHADAHGAVAVKVLLPHLEASDAHVAQFLNEARLACTLRHPNLARGLSYGQADGRHYLALEFVQGKDLGAVAERAWNRSSGLLPNVALQIVAAAADALHHAHGATPAVVHRDVCPQNVMLTYSGAVKVLDFGVAWISARGSDDPPFSKGAPSGRLVGTAAYCSPEQLLGDPLDARADVFGLGVLLHELLTGKRLFRRDSDHQTMLAVIEADVPKVSQLRPELAALDEAVLRALQRDPRRRFSTAGALAEALRALLSPEAPALAGVLAALYPEPPSA